MSPHYLCCKGLDKGSGTTSFKYTYDSIINQGHVSINSTKTNFTNEVKMGFQKQCTIKDSCTASEVCLFKVCDSSPSCRLNSSNPYSIDNAHIADCNNQNTPFSNDFTAKVCCKLGEICSDGVDNDGDTYIDCADEDCYSWSVTNPANPAFCTGSPYNSTGCIIDYTKDPATGAITINYNSSCYGQPPNPQGIYFYCGYQHAALPSNNPGLCCPTGKYPKFNPVLNTWSCEDSAICGIANADDECKYDFDLNKTNWKASNYNPASPNWCQSKYPYFYTPDDYVPYAPRRSTGCCLLGMDGIIGYFTAEDNVKLFGYNSYCGDGILDSGENCDGNYLGTCASSGFTCPQGANIVGSPGCTNCNINISAPYCTCSYGST